MQRQQRSSRLKRIGYATGLLLGVLSYAQAATINVPADFATIQAAIDDPNTLAGDEIIVAPGTYFEAINFNGKAITLRSQSGDPNDTIIDGTGHLHVVQCVSDEDPNTVLSGFTITGGNAFGNFLTDDSLGGGMFNRNSSPTVSYCTFSDNSASNVGGGMYNDASDPTVTNCLFKSNMCPYGGGMFNDYSSPTVVRCTFSDNSAGNVGGGMYNVHGNPTVINCIFSGNTGGYSSGGMENFASNPIVLNCTFNGNSAENQGGGMRNALSDPTVSQCIFTRNSAYLGGGMFNKEYSTPKLANCIFWGNVPDQITNTVISPSSPTISFSNIEGGLPARSIDDGGNIDIDPVFTDPNGLDGVIGTLDDDLRLSVGSPCIDAGDNTVVPVDVTTDLAGGLRFVDDLLTVDTGNGAAPVVDMGAYEYGCPGNLDDIASTVLPDFAWLSLNWMATDCGHCGGADFDGDGNVLINDLLFQAADWLCGI